MLISESGNRLLFSIGRSIKQRLSTLSIISRKSAKYISLYEYFTGAAFKLQVLFLGYQINLLNTIFKHNIK